jgi:WD40 repeat protein
VIKLWDARAAREICTLHLHKNTVNQLKWHSNGHFLLSAGRDQVHSATRRRSVSVNSASGPVRTEPELCSGLA